VPTFMRKQVDWDATLSSSTGRIRRFFN
jgi:hypothetical protein